MQPHNVLFSQMTSAGYVFVDEEYAKQLDKVMYDFGEEGVSFWLMWVTGHMDGTGTGMPSSAAPASALLAGNLMMPPQGTTALHQLAHARIAGTLSSDVLDEQESIFV